MHISQQTSQTESGDWLTPIIHIPLTSESSTVFILFLHHISLNTWENTHQYSLLESHMETGPSLWCWFLSQVRRVFSVTHMNPHTIEMGLPGSPGCSLICRDGPAAEGLKQIGRTTQKLVLILFGPRTSGQGSPLTRPSFPCIIDALVKDKNIKNQSPFLLFSCTQTFISPLNTKGAELLLLLENGSFCCWPEGCRSPQQSSWVWFWQIVPSSSWMIHCNCWGTLIF